MIEPNWHELEQRLRSADTVDQFMKHHFDFLNTCRKECMLTDYRYLESHRKLTNTVTVFAESRARFSEQLDTILEARNRAEASGEAPPELPPSDTLDKIEARWHKHARVRTRTLC